MNTNLIYLALLIFCILFPFIFTLIHKKWLNKLGYYYINKSTIISAIPFILWDYFALYRGHWWFSEKFTIGISVFKLPIEEFIFFILIPQACLLIWVALNKYKNFREFFSDIRNNFKS